jgi:hypothetical protein
MIPYEAQKQTQSKITQWGKHSLFNKWYGNQPESHMKENKCGSYLALYF